MRSRRSRYGNAPVPLHDQPLAAKGLTSYRIRGAYGWIMIGAKDDDDAWREARRSGSGLKRSDLQVWDGDGYRPVTKRARTRKTT